jgi:hypothetical protein
VSRTSKLTAPDFERFARRPCPNSLLGILRHQRFELGFGPLVVEECATGAVEERRELCPGVRCTHIDNADGLNAGAWRLDPEEDRGIAALDAAPEFLFRGQKEVLVKGSAAILISTHLPPPVMIESAASLALVTHKLCWTWAICFCAAAPSENDQGQHEFCLENRSSARDQPIKRRPHPAEHRMHEPVLNAFDGVARYSARTNAD